MPPRRAARASAAALRDDDQYARVRATGRYDAAHQLLVRNRPLEGQVGYYVLTPLVTDAGPALLVDRGWVPAGATADRRARRTRAAGRRGHRGGRVRPSEPAVHDRHTARRAR